MMQHLPTWFLLVAFTAVLLGVGAILAAVYGDRSRWRR